MATSYPSGTDSLTNPAGTSLVTDIDHAAQHTNINDAMEAVQSTAGTTAGTNVLKHFAAGEFPVRATGVAATGTLKQTIFNGTLNNQVVGTPAITGGTATAMKVVGTDVLSNAGLLGTTGIQFVEGTIFGSFTNTAFNNGTNVGSIVFTPQVAVKALIFNQITLDVNPSAARGLVNLTINGTNFGSSSAAGVPWMSLEDPAWPTTSSYSGNYYSPSLPANTAATIITQIAITGAGTYRIWNYNLIVIPFPAT